MTLVRRAAVRISEKVVRRASPGNQEWAEGLAREIAFIEGDWRALGWAIGSLRVLFRNPPPKPLCNASEIARAGRLYAGAREHTPPVFLLMMVLQTLTNGLSVMHPTHRMGHFERVGFAIATVSSAYLAAVVWMAGRMRARPEDMDDGVWIEFYRGEMVRLRGLFAGFGTLLSAAVGLYCAGGVLSIEGWTRPYLTSCLIGFCIFVAWLIPRPAQRFQQKIDDVDSILMQSGRAA